VRIQSVKIHTAKLNLGARYRRDRRLLRGNVWRLAFGVWRLAFGVVLVLVVVLVLDLMPCD
jgi:hypothetical protein